MDFGYQHLFFFFLLWQRFILIYVSILIYFIQSVQAALDTKKQYDCFFITYFLFFCKRQTSISFIFWHTSLKLAEVKTKTNPGYPTNPTYF